MRKVSSRVYLSAYCLNPKKEQCILSGLVNSVYMSHCTVYKVTHFTAYCSFLNSIIFEKTVFYMTQTGFNNYSGIAHTISVRFWYSAYVDQYAWYTISQISFFLSKIQQKSDIPFNHVNQGAYTFSNWSNEAPSKVNFAVVWNILTLLHCASSDGLFSAEGSINGSVLISF